MVLVLTSHASGDDDDLVVVFSLMSTLSCPTPTPVPAEVTLSDWELRSWTYFELGPLLGVDMVFWRLCFWWCGALGSVSFFLSIILLLLLLKPFCVTGAWRVSPAALAAW
jgi:hypothetical protein